ncbi:MAG TPA: site-2 protease family protein [Candidatus Limnocylindrales bacterium]|jgi:Zn-dependent protease|nr:site-2 protease family protein [Candidatus Limnocylindrales bacterium]
MFNDLSSGYLIEVAIVIGIMLLVAFPVHEFSHALAATQLGDSTPRLLGRLTLDPRAHFDPTGATILALSMLFGVGIGWAKPTPYNPMNLRGGRWGEAIIAVAGPISNFVLAIAAAIPLRYIHATGMDVPLIEGVLTLFVTINLLLMVFNLIPIPPLDGSKVLYAFLDPRTSWQVRAALEQYGLLILLGAMFLPIFGGNTLIGVVFNEIFRPLINLVIGQ